MHLESERFVQSWRTVGALYAVLTHRNFQFGDISESAPSCPICADHESVWIMAILRKGEPSAFPTIQATPGAGRGSFTFRHRPVCRVFSVQNQQERLSKAKQTRPKK
jgi:hypothetical protein